MKVTKKITGIKTIHVSPDTGRISISANTPFIKQIMISATIMEGTDEDVFSCGIKILERFTESSDNIDVFAGEDLFRKIRQQETITLSNIETSDSKANTHYLSGVERVMRMPEKMLISITLAKPCIKTVKILSIQLEIGFEEILTLAANLVREILNTIAYEDMSREQINAAIWMQIDRLCE